jgi:ferritin-like metal-binding protein YciE
MIFPYVCEKNRLLRLSYIRRGTSSRSLVAMKLENLHDVLVHELRDLYSAEKQLTKALPKMAKAASNPDLAAGFEKHLEQTEEHVNRLESIFKELEVSSRGDKCKGMEGLIKEGSKVLEEDAPGAVTDALLISAAQRVEHYEIAGYGSAISFAELLGQGNIAKILRETLDEEKATDKKLTEIAETAVNLEAEAPATTA